MENIRKNTICIKKSDIFKKDGGVELSMDFTSLTEGFEHYSNYTIIFSFDDIEKLTDGILDTMIAEKYPDLSVWTEEPHIERLRIHLCKAVGKIPKKLFFHNKRYIDNIPNY